ncbi:fibronectin type III domain-containing protein [Actinoplanes sp. CA-054009]
MAGIVTNPAPASAAPLDPATVTAAAGRRSILVSWTLPGNPGTIGGFRATASGGGGQYCDAAANLRSCTISSLTALTSYTVTVVACTGTPPTDCSSGTTSSAVTPGPPGTPTGVSAAYQDNPNKMRVSWTPGDAGPGIASYKVTANTADPLTGTCATLVAAASSSCEFDNLVSDTSYTFRVQANGVTTDAGTTGSSLVSAASPAKVAGPPHNPAKPTVERLSDSSVTVTWDKPAGGQSITGYSVAGTPSGSCTTADADDTTCDVTGLTGATSYTFKVTATGDAGGASPASDASDAIIPAYPGKPEPPSVELGDEAGEAFVYWEAPADGGTVTQYIVKSFSPDDQSTADVCTENGSTFECTVNSLANAKSYQFTVTAKNAAGEQTSGLSTPPIISELPGEPSKPVVTLGGDDGEVKLTWNAPASGGTLTSYAVTVIPGSGSDLGVKADDCGADLATPSCEITDLDPTVSYTFRVAAVGDLGATAAPDSDAITPAKPGAPQAVVAELGDAEGKVKVTWDAPNTGGTVDTYDVTAASDDGPEDFGCADLAADVTECDIADLDPATEYTFTVTATNNAGTSAGADSDPIVASAPGKPSKPTLTLMDSGEVDLAWNPPTGGGAVTSYTVNVLPATGTDVGVLDPACGDDLDTPVCSVTDLDPAVSYTFTVSAVGGLDTITSDPSDPIVPAAAGVPADVKAELVASTAGRIKVSWSAPDGGTLIDYTVRAVNLNGATAPSNDACVVAAGAAELACTMLGLDVDGEYQFTVEARNALGTGTASTATTALVPDKPTEPQTVEASLVEDTPAAIKVTWTAPASGGAPSSYVVTSASTEAGSESFGCPDVTVNTTECLITGLSRTKHYTFTVSAKNAVDSTAAVATTAIVADKPGAPTTPDVELDVVAGAGNALVTWVEPVAGGEVEGYKVTATSPDSGTLPAVCEADPGETECLVPDLDEDKQYVFTVQAWNLAGGTDSAATDAIVPGVPLAPTDVRVGISLTPGTVVVDWAQPPGTIVNRWTVTPDSADGGNEPTACQITPPQQLRCGFENLSLDKHYTFAITAVNDLGSLAQPYVTDPPVVPNLPNATGAPTAEIVAVDELAETGTITVNWRPAPRGATPILSYTVSAYAESDPDTPYQVDTCIDVPADSTLTCDFPGLPVDDTYTFVVTSTVDGGATADSEPSEPVNLRGPGEPGVPTVELGGANAVRVTWTAPVDGGPILGYDVKSSPIVTTPQNCTNVGAKSRTCIFTGLISGNRYSFNVRANGTGGRFIETEYSLPILVGVPDMPERPAVVPGATTSQVTVSWSRPGDGAGLQGYTVQLDGSDVCTVSGGDNTSCSVSGLTTTRSYRFRVQANGVAGAGDSAFSPLSEAIVPGAPGRPQNVDVVGGDRQIAVSWSAPQYAADRVVSYRVATTPGTGTCTTLAAVRECVINTGVENLTSYRITVVAIASTGLESPASAPSARVRPTAGAPGAPTDVTAASLNAGARVTWVAPAVPGDGVAGYTATAVNSAGSSRSCSTTLLTCTVAGLENGQQYRVTVVALGRGASGYSAPSAAATVTPSVAPNAPTGVGVVVGARTFAVSWTAPTSAAELLKDYTATATGGGSSLTCATTATTCTISGLTPGVSYAVSVVANGQQSGVASAAASGGEIVALTATAPALPSTVPVSAGLLTSSAASPLRAGQTLTISGTGFAPHTGVTLGFYPNAVRLGTVVTDSAGAFSQSVTLSGVSTGTSRTIVAAGMFTAGTVRYKTLTVTVNP